MHYLGVSVTNSVTVNSDDDDFILSSPCNIEFDYYGIVVTDVAQVTSGAYEIWDAMKAAVQNS